MNTQASHGWKWFGGVSAALNCALLIWIGVRPPTAQLTATADVPAEETPFSPAPVVLPAAPVAAPPASTLPTASAAQFHWSQVESPSYPEYICNLRSIGCPEQTIRDIVAADLKATLRGMGGNETAREWQTTKNQERLLNQLFAENPRSTEIAATQVAPGNASSRAPYASGWHAGQPPSSTFAQTPPAGGETETVATPGATTEPDASAAETEPPRAPRELTRRQWVAQYIRTRWGDSAWLGLDLQSGRYGGDIEPVLQQNNITIPDPPRPGL